MITLFYLRPTCVWNAKCHCFDTVQSLIIDKVKLFPYCDWYFDNMVVMHLTVWTKQWCWEWNGALTTCTETVEVISCLDTFTCYGHCKKVCFVLRALAFKVQGHYSVRYHLLYLSDCIDSVVLPPHGLCFCLYHLIVIIQMFDSYHPQFLVVTIYHQFPLLTSDIVKKSCQRPRRILVSFFSSSFSYPLCSLSVNNLLAYLLVLWISIHVNKARSTFIIVQHKYSDVHLIY